VSSLHDVFEEIDNDRSVAVTCL